MDANIGRVVCILPLGKKQRMRFETVESVHVTKSRCAEYVLSTGAKLKVEEEGVRWCWFVGRRTGGIVLRVDRTGQVPSGEMLDRLLAGFLFGKLPKTARGAIRRCLWPSWDLVQARNAALRLEVKGTVIDAQLPCSSALTAGLSVELECHAGPGAFLHLWISENCLGVGNRRSESFFKLARLPLPLRSGSALEVLRTVPQRRDDHENPHRVGSMLGGLWTEEGLALHAERDDSGNVLQLITWDGNLSWDLRARDLPSIDWLDAICVVSGTYVLICTSLTQSILFLQWSPARPAAEATPWAPGKVLLGLMDAHSRSAEWIGLHLVHSARSGFAFVAHCRLPVSGAAAATAAEAAGDAAADADSGDADSDGEVLICAVWRLDDRMELLASAELRGTFASGVQWGPLGSLHLSARAGHEEGTSIYLDGATLKMLKREVLELHGDGDARQELIDLCEHPNVPSEHCFVTAL